MLHTNLLTLSPQVHTGFGGSGACSLQGVSFSSSTFDHLRIKVQRTSPLSLSPSLPLIFPNSDKFRREGDHGRQARQ